jgi:autotransporter-associated beta strand protein
MATGGTWLNGVGGNYNFTDSTQWFLGNVPGGAAGDLADFAHTDLRSGDTTISLNTAGITLGQINVNDGQVVTQVIWNLTGPNFLTLDNAGLAPVINVGSMGGVGNGTGFARISASIHGTSGLTFTGTGGAGTLTSELVLDGANTYTGVTTIASGTLQIRSSGGLGNSSVFINGGTLDLRSDNSTNFAAPVVLGVNSTINVDSIPNDGPVAGQSHTIGGFSFGAAGATRTLTITSTTNQLAGTAIDGYGLNLGAVTLNDNGVMNSNTNGAVTMSTITSNATGAATFSIGGSNSFAGNMTVSGAVSSTGGPLSLNFTNNTKLFLNGALNNTNGTIAMSAPAATTGGTIQLGSGISLGGQFINVSNGTLDLNNGNASNSTTGGIFMGGNSNGSIVIESGHLLNVAGSVNFATGTGTSTIAGNINIQGASGQSFNINSGSTNTTAAQMTVTGAITDAGGGLTKTGAGTLEFLGDNTSSGTLVMNGGTLLAEAHVSGSPLGTGTLNMSTGVLRFDNTSAGSLGGGAGTLVIGQSSSGSAELEVSGNATTVLNLNSFGGRVAGTSGVLTIVPNEGVLNGSGTDQITLTTSPTALITANHGILPAYVVTQNSGSDTTLDFVTVNGSKQMVAGATAGIYASNLTGGATSIANVSGGDIGSTTTQVFALRSSAAVNGSGGTLVVGDDTNPGGIILNATQLNVSNLKFGPTGLSEGIVWSGNGNSTVASAITLNNLMTTGGAGQLTFTGPITLSGTGQSINVDAGTTTVTGTLVGGGLTKTGPGVLVLNGSYTGYSGTMTATAGTLQIGDGGANGTISNSSNLVANSNIVSNRSDLVTWGNAISGAGNIVQNGAGTLVLSGALTYGGNLVVNTGTAKTTGAVLLPTASGLMVNGGTFDLNGLNQNVATLSNTSTTGGIITSNVAGNISLTAASGVFNGTISNGTGVVSVVKGGSGTLTLNESTASNTYTGGTTINNGTLYLGDGSLGNSHSLGSGSVVLQGGTLAMATAFGNGAGATNLTNALFVPIGQTGGFYMGQLGSQTGAITSGDTTSVLNIGVPPSSQWGFGSTTGRFAGNVAGFTGQINVTAPNGPGAFRIAAETSSATATLINRLHLGDNVSAIYSQNPPNGGTTASTKNVFIGELTGTSLSFFGGSSVAGRFVLAHIGSANTDSQFDGVLTDSFNAQGFVGPGVLRVDKVGTGKWTLTNSATYTGLTTVSGGVLSIASGGNLSGTSTITTSAGATLEFLGTGTMAPIGGNGGTTTIVNNGNFSAPAGFTTPAGVTMNGTGTVFGNYVHSGGTLNANTAGTAGQLTFHDNLTLSPGSNVGVDVNGSTGAGVIGGVNDLLNVGGQFTLNATSTASAPTFRVNFLGSTPTAVGQLFPVIQYQGSPVINGALSNVPILSGIRGSFSLVQGTGTLANTIDLQVNSLGTGAAFLTWTGAHGTGWDINTTQNWKDNAGNPATYFDGDNVAFLSNTGNSNLFLLSNVSPTSMLFDSNIPDYSINGSAAINGAGSLTKNNTNILTINTANGYTGGTTVNGGSLILNNAAGAGTGSITLNDGASLYQPTGIGNALNIGGTGTSVATLAFATDNNATFGGNITGTGTLKLVVNTIATATNIINLGGSVNAFVGTIDMSNLVSPTTMRITSTINAPNLVMNVGGGGALLYTRNGGTATIGGLQGGANSFLAGSQALLAPQTWVIGGASINGGTVDTEFAGTIENQGTLPTTIIKAGTSTLKLDGQSTYTGPTIVNGGTLQLNGAVISSPTFTVNTGGTLSVSGNLATFAAPSTIINLAAAGGAMDVSQADNTGNGFAPGGSVTLVGSGGTVYGTYNHNSGTLAPGNGLATVGTINFNDELHLSGGTIQFDLGATNTVGGGVNDLITAGTVDFDGTTPFFVGFLSTPALNTPYTLISYQHENGDFHNLSLNTRATFSLADTGTGGAGAIQLTITGFNAGLLTWTGANGNTWDVANSANWKDSAANPDKFFQQDNVVFDDSPGVQQNIQINSPVVPGSVLVNTSTNNFTFAGNGTIQGGASLTKMGTGTLTIANSNSYTGGTNINAGTIAIQSAQPYIGTATINNAAIAAVEPANTTLSFGASATEFIPGGSTGTISLISNNAGSTSSTVVPVVGVIMNGTLSGGTTTSGATANILLTNTTPTTALQPVMTDINTNNSAFIGTINILNNGTTTLRLGTAAGAPNAFWNLGSSGTVSTNTGTVTTTIAMGGLSGGPNTTLQGFVGYQLNAGGTLVVNSAGGPAVYQIGSLNTDSTFNGQIIDGIGTLTPQSVSITKFGTANLTFTGTDTYSGATTISGGTLVIGATGSIANSNTLNLNGGALNVTAPAAGYTTVTKTFTGSGTVYGNVTHSLGTITPGTSGTVGTLSVTGNLSLTTESLNYDIGTASLTPNGNSDLISVGGVLSLTGTSTLNANFLQTPAVGSYPVITDASRSGAGTITLGNLGLRPGSVASLDFSSATQVNLAITSLAVGNLTWRGAGNNGGLWDVNSTANWISDNTNTSIASVGFDKFFQNDKVNFLDTASAPLSVVLNTAVSPSSVVVNSNTNNYTFGGTGSITGPGNVSKSGTSTLTFSGANTYLGGTTINNGWVNVGALGSSALGSGSIVLNGGTLVGSGTGTVTFGTPINAAAASTSTIEIDGTGAVGAINGNLTGTGAIVLASTNVTKLFDVGGSNAFFGGSVTVAGTQTIRLGAASGSGLATWNLPAGGTISTNSGTTSSVTIIPLGALNGVATSTLKGYNAGGTGGNTAYQLGDAGVNANFQGNIIDGLSGATVRTVSIIKSGATSTQTLSGSNSYTGVTQVNAGTLVLSQPNSWALSALTTATPTATNGSIVNGGRLIFDYTGNVANSPATTVKNALTAGFAEATRFSTGLIRTGNVVDNNHGLGWTDDGSTKVTVAYTYYGDADLNGSVNIADFNTLAAHFASSGTWQTGDFNYDGVVNLLDLNAVATNFGATPVLSTLPSSIPLGALLSNNSPALGTLVPEPASLGMIALGATALLRRRRRQS